MTPDEGRRNDAEQLTEQIVQMVSELPDRTSPDDWPEAMLVTATELRAIVADALSPAGRRPPESAEWQPIETAPQDGTRVMVYAEEFRRRIFGIAYYWRGVPGDGEGWVARSIYSQPDDDFRGALQNPTHWMPLPAPPSSESAREAVRPPAAEESK